MSVVFANKLFYNYCGSHPLARNNC